MDNNGDRICKVHSLEFGVFEIQPGGSLRLGRHSENDIVLKDSMVSRFHARITWDKGVDTPVVFDNGSQNGTQVGGETIRTARQLQNQDRISIGPFMLRVELVNCGEQAAILGDTNDMVTLFSDDGPELRGALRPDFTLVELMQRLESERRTGTLNVEGKDSGKALVTFCLGRVMSASLDGVGTGLRALERIVMTRKGKYHFNRELEPREDSLNMWLSDFLRSRNMDPAQKTQKFYPTRGVKRPGR